jgi:hypothetical protein
MARMTKADVEIEREAMVEELDEWFDDPYDAELPLWVFWPAGDAGFSVEDVDSFDGIAADGFPTADGYGRRFDAIREQILNASSDQIKNYADARVAWLERV